MHKQCGIWKVRGVGILASAAGRGCVRRAGRGGGGQALGEISIEFGARGMHMSAAHLISKWHAQSSGNMH